MRKKAMRNVSIMTELSTEKVELGLIDDAKKLISNLKNAQQIFDDIESVSKEAVKEYTNLQIRKEKVKDTFNSVIGMETIIRNANKLTGRADDIIRQINKQAQDLGISPTQIKEYDELFDFNVKIAEGVNKSDKFIRDIKGLNNELK
tara:strand:- start:640 stop:1080 length:441 start_codon:yes stop_codon:yes gene_type:complete